jgi:phage terminase large subunit-like protein
MTKRKNNSSLDPTTAYATDVLDGKIVAGGKVKDACRRHLLDLKIGHERGIHFSVEKAQWAIDFFKEMLCLNGGQFEGQPYELLPWQSFIVGSLFGWIADDGYRRFRVAYIETAKGSGKSPLAAGIGLYGLVADKEARAEVYAAATKKDQAMILFRDAVAMVDQSPELSGVLKKSGVGQSVWNLAYLKSASFFRPISADDGQSGPRPSVALLDEVHEHKNDNVVEMLKAGFKFRKQPLMVMITNSGFNKQTVCWQYHEFGMNVNSICAVKYDPEDRYCDDATFAYICSIDEGEDPFKDEACWYKANPSLAYGLPGLKYIRDQVASAKGMPAKESFVRRLNFCEWVGAEDPWISADVWFSCQDEFDIEEYAGRKCWGGLDLSSVRDLCSFVLLFEPTDSDPVWRLKPYFWLPSDGLMEKSAKDGVKYKTWLDSGYLRVTDGKAVNKLAVAIECARIADKFDLQMIGYDRWLIEEFKALLDREGITLPLTPFGQGFKDMAPAVNELETLIVNGHIAHDGNPVMTWNAANAIVVKDPAGNRKVAKDKATGRMDGIVAALMAVGISCKAIESLYTPEIIML